MSVLSSLSECLWDSCVAAALDSVISNSPAVEPHSLSRSGLAQDPNNAS